MLKIAKMEITGFKSFSDGTEVVFPDGITAVVGPNGCGKSNIGDAINWVLGEQSARMLRGASMQDVIFNGSEARKPLGMAEVSLHLRGQANGNGATPKAITITRRLFRSGDSEYLLNGARSRLRDIQDLLRDERVGAQTYATIEQGRIDQILNAKPKERRLIIEEAAGVAGFKHKRRLAELRLEATHANLLRVNDIVLEVTRQINALKRQAAKARRYGRLRDELRAKEAVRFGARAKHLEAELASLRAHEAAFRDAEAEAASRLATLEAAIVADRIAVEDATRAASAEAEGLHQLEMEIDRGEERVRSCRERIAEAQESEQRLAGEIAALEARGVSLADEARRHAEATAVEEGALAEARAGLDALRGRVAEASGAREARRERVEALRREMFGSMNLLADRRNRRSALDDDAGRLAVLRARLERERGAAQAEHLRTAQEAAGLGVAAESQRASIEQRRAAVEQAESELADVRARHASGLAALAAARERETSATAALRTLEDVATRFAGVSDGVRLLLTAGERAGVRTRGVVADFVSAAPEVEGAAEAYLQAFLPAVVVEDDGDAARAVDLIRREGAGRTVFLCKTQPSGAFAVGAPANGHAPIPETMRSDPRVLGRLRDRLTLPVGDGFVSDRIGDAVLVDCLVSALELHRSWPHADYLTTTGEVVYASGVVAAGGRAAADRGLLAHNRKTAVASAEVVETAARTAALQAALIELDDALERAGAMLADRRRALESEGKRGAELDLAARRTEDDRARSERRLEILGGELEGIAFEAERLSAAVEAAAEEVIAAESAHAASEARLVEETAAFDAEEAGERELLDAEAQARAEAAGREQRVHAALREAARFAHDAAEVAERLRESIAERDATARRAVETSETLAVTESELAAQWEQRRRRAEDAAAREESLAARRVALAEREAAQRDARISLDLARENARAGELARTKAESDRRFLDDLCRQELGLSAGDAALAAGEEALASADDAALTADIAAIKARVDAIGPVNLMAIEEFRALEERQTNLTAQKKDLEDAIASLRESIKRINRQSRERFVEAFETIRVHYQEIFKVLFNGGRADLVLEEGEDVLECGIEMIAQPPGKRLGQVSLMSGGEKSMAALALLFAIFRYQPSPFCLLDEVDAALDELNVGRFTRMLSEYAMATQFILITHNKRSMEAANLLYGVTMEEPGVSKVVSLKL
jgi:chromosome segregation protein